MNILAALLAACGVAAGVSPEVPPEAWLPVRSPRMMRLGVLSAYLVLTGVVAGALALWSPAPVILPWASVIGVALLGVTLGGATGGFTAAAAVTAIAMSSDGPDPLVHPAVWSIWPSQWYSIDATARTAALAAGLLALGVAACGFIGRTRRP